MLSSKLFDPEFLTTVEALPLGSEFRDSTSSSPTATVSPRREINGLGLFTSWTRSRLIPWPFKSSRGYWECNHEDEDECVDRSEVEEAKVKQGDGIGSRYEEKG